MLFFLQMLFFLEFSSPPNYQLPIARVSARTYRAHKRSANLLGSRNQTPPPISQAMLWRESDAVTQSGSQTSAVLLPRRLPSNLQVHPRGRDRILRSNQSHSFASSSDCRSPTKFWTLLESLVRTRTIFAESWSSCESWETWKPRDDDEELPQMAKASYTSSRDWRSFSTDSLLLLLLLFSHKKPFLPMLPSKKTNLSREKVTKATLALRCKSMKKWTKQGNTPQVVTNCQEAHRGHTCASVFSFSFPNWIICFCSLLLDQETKSERFRELETLLNSEWMNEGNKQLQINVRSTEGRDNKQSKNNNNDNNIHETEL